MKRYFYSPATGELINVAAKADWMGETTLAPPSFDPALESAIWRGDHWELVAFTPPAAVVPDAVPALQALLAIDRAGLSSAYESWAAHADRTFAERAFISRAQMWRRVDPTLSAAAAALGLTTAQVDSLFLLAASM